MKKILVLHGPNLNLLGMREPGLYGTTTLAEINSLLVKKASVAGAVLDHFQSNHEGALIDAIHRAASEKIAWFIVNGAALSHSSIALRDALAAVAIPFIEVHLTNIYKRESFRKLSFLSDIAEGIICGLGSKSYTLALDAILELETKG